MGAKPTRQIRLTNSQSQSLDKLILQLKQEHAKHQRIRGESAEDAPSEDLVLHRKDEFSNIFGIFGPRGAGKSTLLYELYRHATANDLKPFKVLEPLDCSNVHEDIEPGMGILLHLLPVLRSSNTCFENRKAKESERLEKILKELVSTYSYLTDHHKELRLDLASSPQRFARDLVEDVENRLNLAKDVASLMDEVAAHLDVKVIVVPLDDFDLVKTGGNIRRWFYSMLDELHQVRLFFVVTADFHRLEHLIYDPETELDDETSRAILHKILPWQNRISLDDWKSESQRHFVHLSTGAEKEDTLGVLLRESLDTRRDLLPLVFQLLPSWPRGLVNLYDTLYSEIREPHHPEKGLASLSTDFPRFLRLLATCRGEPILMRRIEERGLEEMDKLLGSTPRNLPPEDWRETVAASCQRCQDSQELRPIRGLQPISWSADVSASHIQRGEASSRRRVQPPLGAGRLLVLGSREHDPAWQDPLRHDELWSHPLRDADETAQAFWTELLLTASFQADTHFKVDTDRAVRNRLSFFDNWGPASSRLEEARMWAVLIPVEVRHFFDDYEHCNLRPVLYWLCWDLPENEHWKDTGLTVEIGWPSLLDGLRRKRDPLLTRMLSELHLDTRSISGDLPPVSPQDALGLIPDQVWAMVLLVDGLHRCPWSAFSARLGWHLPTYLMLAGVLVQGAYLHAMNQADLLEEDQLLPPQELLVEVLDKRDASYLLLGEPREGRYVDEESHEEKVFERLAAILECPLPTTSKDGSSRDDPLTKAARSFMELAPYRALRDLADEGLLL